MNIRLRHSRWLWTVVALAPLLLARALPGLEVRSAGRTFARMPVELA